MQKSTKNLPTNRAVELKSEVAHQQILGEISGCAKTLKEPARNRREGEPTIRTSRDSVPRTEPSRFQIHKVNLHLMLMMRMMMMRLWGM